MFNIKSTAVFAILLQIAAAVSLQFEDSTCPATGLSYLPHYSNCSMFFECLNGNKELLSCPADYAWSITQNQCVHKEEADCSYTTVAPTPSDGVTCPATGLSYLPHYGDCKLFFECLNGNKITLSCPADYAWSIPKNQCVHEEEADCSYTTLFPTTVAECPANGISYLPVYSNCKQYFRCDNGVKSIQTCSNGYAWSIVIQACDLEELVDCSYTTVVPITTTVAVCPADELIYLPVASNCKKYIRCDYGVKTIETCADGYAWSIIIQACDLENLVDCSYTSVTPTVTPPLTTVTPKPTTVTTPRTTISPGPSDNVCIGVEDGDFKAYLPDCTKFIICIDQKEHVTDCFPTGTCWSPTKEQCDQSSCNSCISTLYPTSSTNTTPTKPTVTTVTTPKTTPANNRCIGQPEGTFFPHPSDCTKYIECTHNREEVMDCAIGTTWDQAIKTCDFNAAQNCQ